MRKVAILLVLLACDSESETFRCADWLVCFDECQAFEEVATPGESTCVGDCGTAEVWDDEIFRSVWLNDGWLEESLLGLIEREPKPLYDALKDARRACYSAP